MVDINGDAFCRRIAKLYTSWQVPESVDTKDVGRDPLFVPDAKVLFQNADALVFNVGKTEEAILYQKSTALQAWLLGYEFPDTLMVFTRQSVIFMTGNSRLKHLDPLKEARERYLRDHSAQANGGNDANNISPKALVDPTMCPELKLLVRNNDVENNNTQFEIILGEIAKSGSGSVVGIPAKDKFMENSNAAYHAFQAKLADRKPGFSQVDISPGLARVLAVKDLEEVGTMQKASTYSAAIMDRYITRKLEVVADQKKKMSHLQLAEQCEAAIADPKRLKFSINADLVDSCFLPIIQSGGKYDLRVSAMSNEDQVKTSGVVTASLGARYRSYCSNVGRTFMFNVSNEVKRNYRFLLKCQEYLIKELQPGVVMGDVFRKFINYVQDNNPDLLPYCVKNVGFVTGLEFREGSLVFNNKNQQVLLPNMMVVLSVGFQNVPAHLGADDDKKENEQPGVSKQSYALFVADTVQINKPGLQARVLTQESVKDAEKMQWTIDDSKPAVDEKKAARNGDVLGMAGVDGPRTRGARNRLLEERTRGAGAGTHDEEKMKAREEHQIQLKKRMHEQGERRYQQDAEGDKEKTMKVYNSYRTEDDFPADEREIRELRIFVDRKRETFILPIYGVPVPFHVSTLKNVNKTEQGEYHYLRIIFKTPISDPAKAGQPQYAHPYAHYVREMTYRTMDAGAAGSANRILNEALKRFKEREKAIKELEDVIEQDALQLAKGNVPRLNNLSIRPTIGRKIHGYLEVHTNGFRYVSIRNQKVDVLFNNIKHAFFQPCDHEMITLIHFHLKNPIIIEKKKTRDIQFYAEVAETSTALGRRNNMYDRDEIESEERERQHRARLNKAFKKFCERADDSMREAGMDIEFEVPIRELGFMGVPNRSNVFVMPTVNALVSLVEQPAFVLSLSDIELVHLERVEFHLKNFDMVFIFKDYMKNPIKIDSVPSKNIETIKDWLDSVDIPFYAGPKSLQWANIMKLIRQDIPGFFQEGEGWSFLEAEGDESEEEEVQEEESDLDTEEKKARKKRRRAGLGGDDDWAPDSTDEEVFEESESDFDESDAVDSEDASEFEADSEEDEEEGMDWDELEEEARRADRKHAGYDSEEEDDRPTKKKRRR
eukprot:Clim_evm107s134 gene=Clim_evmTU107s134